MSASATVQQPGLKRELFVYYVHIVALLLPGRRTPTFQTVGERQASVGELTGWTDEEIDVLLEEGRRYLERQSARFDRIRQTAQVVLPIGMALLIIVGATLRSVEALTGAALWVGRVAWVPAVLLVGTSVLGSAAILVNRASFGTVLPTLLSQTSPPIKRTLARTYAEQQVAGDNELNTRLTLQWWSVFFLLSGGTIYLIVWCAVSFGR